MTGVVSVKWRVFGEIKAILEKFLEQRNIAKS